MIKAPRQPVALGVAGALAATLSLLEACSGEDSAAQSAEPPPGPGTGADAGPVPTGTSDPSKPPPPSPTSTSTAPSGPPGEPPPPNDCRGSLPATFMSICNTCHTVSSTPNSRYPDLYQFKGTLEDFTGHVRNGSPKGMARYSAELVPDADVAAIYAYFTGGGTRGDTVVDLGGVAPLFAAGDRKNPPVVFTRSDGVLVTRGAGRVRGRHEGPLDTNEPFMEFPANYFTSRTYGWIVEDFTVLGESRIRVTYLPVARPTDGTNFRAWKMYDNGDVFSANMGMKSDVALPSLLVGGTDLAASYQDTVAPYARIQQQETTRNARSGAPIAKGDLLEFEFGVFSDAGTIQPPGSRTAYYTDTFRYQVGIGGVTASNPDPYDGAGVLGPTDAAQQGGATTNVWAYFMPETQFGQMALNVQHENAQAFVEGRRLFHTNFTTGAHSEAGNPVFTEQMNKAGPHGTTKTCRTCHVNNGPGRALDGPLGPESSMAFKLYGAGPLGNQLQPADGTANRDGTETKTVTLADGTSVVLSRPTFAITVKTGAAPAYSARVARKVIGMGLLEAIDERTLLARADSKDCNGDGISGRPSFVEDPTGGALRLGRFGWKAEKVSVAHQAAEAAFDDMGVGTSLFPDSGKAELSDGDLARLVTYMRLVAVPGQRDHDSPQVQEGQQIFKTIGCSSCHATDVVTGENHPFSELRTQNIKPYSDLLLHDMGPDLADASGIAASDDAAAPPAASEWRTPPLWGTGLLSVINGNTGLLHDGRARNVLEAVLWHGGEAEATKQRVTKLPQKDREALVAFVLSL